MELKQYWKIIKRRLWIVMLLTLVAAIANLTLYFLGTGNYLASVRFVISVRPEERTGSYYGYDKLYAFQSAEYLADDFSQVVKSGAFAQDMQSELGEAVAIDAIKAAKRTEKTHRILELTIVADDQEKAKRLGEAAVAVIEKKGGDYFAQLVYERAVIKVIDPPKVVREGAGLRGIIDLAVRTVLGLILGVALAFFLHYLDTTFYEAKEVEAALRVPVLGEIPRYR